MIISGKKRVLLPVVIGIAGVLLLQAMWMREVYKQTRRQLMADVEEAFREAYGKEQTYRVPVVDIVNPGAVTIESCGTEEVQIIRRCPTPDTIVYNNPSGHSIERFINRVFVDLREHITPMNINCLADLFAGMLHDKDIAAYFVIERLDVLTDDVLDTSLLPDKKQVKMKSETTLLLEISEKESLRAIMQITPGIIFGRMAGVLTLTLALSFVVMLCLCVVSRYVVLSGDDAVSDKEGVMSSEVSHSVAFCDENREDVFAVGQYCFDPAKNELCGFGSTVQLNKKENAILYALCLQRGNVVERSLLLEENWGDNGVIYSRSLDTYITTLRKYLRQDLSIQIVTVKGVGYKLVC